MAYGIVPPLKEPYVCEQPCSHKDCAAQRRLIASDCSVCGAHLEAGDRFYETPEGDFQHDSCFEDQEAQRRRVSQ